MICSEVLEGLSFLKPKVSPFDLKRVGRDKDGGYLVPDDLVGVTACFSPGVNNFKEFEDQLSGDYGVRCHMCDYSSDIEKLRTPLIPGLQTFKKKWLDIDGSADSISLEEWVRELEPNPADDLLLQMDIEGAEFRNIIACPEEVLNRFRIIVIEIHYLNVCKSESSFQKDLGPLLRKFSQSFVSVHAHGNNCCGEFSLDGCDFNIPNVIEITLLRKDRFEGREPKYVPSLPHPLDISSNVAGKPPLFLNEAWSFGGIRTLDSKLKLLEDKVAFYEREQTRSRRDFEAHMGRLIQRYNAASQRLTKRILQVSARSVDGDLSDLAIGKQYRLSSVHGNGAKSGIVGERAPYFFHTGFGVDQFITIDLGECCQLHSLEVVNRLDGCRGRARSLFYVVHEGEEWSVDLGLPLSIGPGFVRSAGEPCLTPIEGVLGRYLTIYSPEFTAIHLSAIRVRGFPSAT